MTLYMYILSLPLCFSSPYHKWTLVDVVSHQTIVMQYILERGKQLNRDPRSCMPGFFERYIMYCTCTCAGACLGGT